MRILVTGRHGQVAASLAERTGRHELVFAARPELDLADAGSIERVVGEVYPDLVISAAAYTAVDKAEAAPEVAMAINGRGPGVLARAAARIGAPIIHLSTDYVFDGNLDRPCREDDPVAPINVYGATKLAGERAIAGAGATYAILRTSWVYSPFGSNFVRTMLRLAETRDSLNVVDDQRGCPTSAFDVADAIMAVVARWQRDVSHGSSGVWHVAGTGETDWAGFARAILAESARRGGPSAEVRGIPTNDYPTPATRPQNSRLDSSRFAQHFGYRAPPWRSSLGLVMDRLMPSASSQAN